MITAKDSLKNKRMMYFAPSFAKRFAFLKTSAKVPKAEIDVEGKIIDSQNELSRLRLVRRRSKREQLLADAASAVGFLTNKKMNKNRLAIYIYLYIG